MADGTDGGRVMLRAGDEDWLRRRRWDVRGASGRLIETLAEYARMRGEPLEEAARALLALPAVDAAPAGMVAEARALLGE